MYTTLVVIVGKLKQGDVISKRYQGGTLRATRYITVMAAAFPAKKSKKNA